MKYGARHLKRTIERLVVHPISNLIASDQIHWGDWIRIDHTSGSPAMSFHREGEHLPVFEMAKWRKSPETFVDAVPASVARGEVGKVQAIRSSRRM